MGLLEPKREAFLIPIRGAFFYQAAFRQPGDSGLACFANIQTSVRKMTCNGFWSTLCFIVSASRSPPGLDPKRVHFWSSFSPGSEKGPLLELIGFIFGSFFNPWEHFGSAGSHVLITKRFESPRVRREVFTLKYLQFAASIWELFLEDFLIYGALLSSIVFCWVPGTTFHGLGFGDFW